MWFLGDRHDTCNDLCAFKGYEGCGADEIKNLDALEEVEAELQLLEPSATCDSTSARAYGAFYQSSNNKCFHAAGVDCDRNDSPADQPLCYCKGTTATTTSLAARSHTAEVCSNLVEGW